MNSVSKRTSALSVSLTNGTIVSLLCLAVGTGAEWIRSRFGYAWAERMSLAAEALPARILETLGALPWLRSQLAEGRWSIFQIRVLYAVTTVVSIFALALSTGVLLMLIGWLWSRLSRQPT